MFFFSFKLCSFNSCSVLRRIAFSGFDHVLSLSAVSKEEALLFRFKTHKKRMTASDFGLSSDSGRAHRRTAGNTCNGKSPHQFFLVFVPSLDFASHRESRRTESEPRAPPGPLSRSFCQSQFTSVSLTAAGPAVRSAAQPNEVPGGLSLAWNNTPQPPPIQTWRCVYNEIVNICWCQRCTEPSA